MNEITFRCPSCNKSLRLRDLSLVGKKIRCPNCSTVTTIPGPSPAEEPPAVKPQQQAVKAERPAPPKVDPDAVSREKPVKHRRVPDEDEDEDDRPKRRHMQDDDEDDPRPRRPRRREPAPSSGKPGNKGASVVVGILAALLAIAFVTVAGMARYAGLLSEPPRVKIASKTTREPPGDRFPPKDGDKQPPDDKKKPPDDKEKPPDDKKPEEKPDVAALTTRLKDADAATRAGAAESLGRLGKDALPATPNLVALLGDEDAEVRKKVSEAIRALGSEPRSVLIDFYASWCPPCQRMKPITTRLVKEGLPLWEIDSDKYGDLTSHFDVKFVPTYILIKEGKEVSRGTGEHSEDALRDMMKELPKQKADTPLPADLKDNAAQARWMALLLALMDDDPWVRFQATRTLRTQGAGTVGALVQVAKGKYPDVLRVGATNALGIAVAGQPPVKEVVALLKGILADSGESTDLHGQAAILAHNLKVADDQIEQIGLLLVTALKSGKRPLLRVDAAACLGDLRNDEAIPALIDALKDKDDRLQDAAIVALGKMGGRAGAAIPDLLELYDKKPEDYWRNRIRQACQQIVPSSKEAAPALVKVLKDGSNPLRLLALDLLETVEDPKTAEASLVPLLEAKSPELRIRAAGALQQMGLYVPAAAKMLIETLKDERENYQAANVLRLMGRRAAPLLVECITQPKRTPRERQRAARILSGVAWERKSIRPALEKGLKDEDEHVRLASALVLARMTPLGEPGASATGGVAPLVAGLESADRNTRQECAHALASTRQKAAGQALLAALEKLDKQGEDKEDTRRQVAYALSSFELTEKEIDRLLALLKQPKSRMAAALALGRRGKEASRVTPLLLEVYSQAKDEDRQDLGEVLLEQGKPAVAGLLKLFEDTKAAVALRLDALRLLGQMGEQAHDPRATLEKYLKDPNKQVKQRVAMTLAALQSDADLVPVLLEALADEREGFQAQYALRHLGPKAKAAVDPLCEMLKGADRNKRSFAMQLLPVIGADSEKARTAMLALLKSKEDANLRQSAVYSIAQFGERIVPALITVLSDADVSRPDVVRVLQQMGRNAKAASPALTKLLLDKDRALAAQAALALATVDPKQADAVPVLLEAFRTKDRTMRYSVLNALGNFGPEARSAVPMLVDALKNAETRGSALSVLGRIGPDAEKAVEPITRLLSSREKSSAAYTLGAIGPPASPAVPKLLAMLEDDQHWYAAASALGRIGEPAKKAVPLVVKQLADEDLRPRAIRVLGSVGKLDPDVALPPLEKLTKDADTGVRGAAIQSLGLLQSPKAVSPLLDILKDEDLNTRLQAVGALGQLGPHGATAVGALKDLLEGKDEAMRRAATTALGGLGDAAEPAVPALIKALEDKELRPTAIYALGRIGAKAEAAIPHLVKLLGDPKARNATVYALGQFGPKAKEALPGLQELAKESKGYQLTQIQQSIRKIEGGKDD
jgi:HEAT repeat protein